MHNSTSWLARCRRHGCHRKKRKGWLGPALRVGNEQSLYTCSTSVCRDTKSRMACLVRKLTVLTRKTSPEPGGRREQNLSNKFLLRRPVVCGKQGSSQAADRAQLKPTEKLSYDGPS